MNYPFENLVFEGGGIKGMAYLGMLQVLDANGILTNVQNVAGASAGAITATLVAMADNYSQIDAMMSTLDFSKIKDKGLPGENHSVLEKIKGMLDNDFEDMACIWRLVKQNGWYTSDYFYQWLRTTINQQYYGSSTLGAPVTFKMFGQKFKRTLCVIGTDMTLVNSLTFSEALTPDMEVATAVRISMSIPLFFESIPFQYPGRSESDIFSDGGVLWNYPLTIFDEEGISNPKTLGGRLFTAKSKTPPKPVKNLIGYIEHLFEALLAAQGMAYDLSDECDKKRSININDMGVPTTDFDLTPEQKTELIDSGKSATEAYLKAYIPCSTK